MPLQFPGDDPLDFSFSTPSSDGLETMSSDEESTSSTRLPPLGQFPSLGGGRKSTARASSPDKSFSQNGGTAITTKLLSVLSSYRKSPRASCTPRRGSNMVFRKASVGGGGGGDASVGHDSNDHSIHSSGTNKTPVLNGIMSRSFSPQRSFGGGMSTGEICGSDAMIGSGELISPTNQSRNRSTTHKLPGIPLSKMMPTIPTSNTAYIPSGTFTPTATPSLLPRSIRTRGSEEEEIIVVNRSPQSKDDMTAMMKRGSKSIFTSPGTLDQKESTPRQLSQMDEQAKKQQQSEDARKAKLLGFLGGSTREKGVVAS